MLVIFTSYETGKLISVWNDFRQLRNHLKKTQTHVKGIKRILYRNSEYIKTMRFSYELSGWHERLTIFCTIAYLQ